MKIQRPGPGESLQFSFLHWNTFWIRLTLHQLHLVHDCLFLYTLLHVESLRVRFWAPYCSLYKSCYKYLLDQIQLTMLRAHQQVFRVQVRSNFMNPEVLMFRFRKIHWQNTFWPGFVLVQLAADRGGARGAVIIIYHWDSLDNEVLFFCRWIHKAMFHKSEMETVFFFSHPGRETCWESVITVWEEKTFSFICIKSLKFMFHLETIFICRLFQKKKKQNDLMWWKVSTAELVVLRLWSVTTKQHLYISTLSSFRRTGQQMPPL